MARRRPRRRDRVPHTAAQLEQIGLGRFQTRHAAGAENQAPPPHLLPGIADLGRHRLPGAVHQGRGVPEAADQAFPGPVAHLGQRRPGFAIMVVDRLDRVARMA